MTEEQSPVPRRTTRRPLLRLATGGVALAAVGAAARVALHPGDGRPGTEPGALILSADAGQDVASLTLGVDDDVAPRVRASRWESSKLATSAHSMVGLTWPSIATAPAAWIRSRISGAWGDWTRLPLMHDVPDGEETSRVAGTDLMWIGRADGVQVRIEGNRPDGLALVLLHPRGHLGDRLETDLSLRVVSERADDPVPRPKLITRAKWGADESLRDGRPTYNHTIKQVHVHHTVNSNTYSRDDVPALIRGMYAYHTQSLGWSDIGYNFLVDRFGRAFVGRAGGPDKLVRGAHTLGFNAQSTGIAAIGNYDVVRPTKAMLAAIAAIAAWRLDPFDRDPRGRTRIRSEGSDRFAPGRRVILPVIDGHRDTNETACPGRHLYDALPRVRRRTARLMNADQQRAIVVEVPATIVAASGNAVGADPAVVRLGDTLRVDPGTFRPEDAAVSYRWLRGDRPIRGAREKDYRVRPWDVGHPLSCRVTLTAEGLDPVDQITPSVGPVTTEPAIAVNTTSPSPTVRITASLTAPPDVRPRPGGQVTFRVGDRTKTVPINNGRAVVRFGGQRRMRPGTYRVIVDYPGDAAFTATKVRTTVEVV